MPTNSLPASSPHRFTPTVSDVDVYLFNEGNHHRLWEVLGANVRDHEGSTGVSFAVWAPNAVGVSVIGDFCDWDSRVYPMRSLGQSGIFETFVPGVQAGALYQFEITTKNGSRLLKADPMAKHAEVPPARASRVHQSQHVWNDAAWTNKRQQKKPTQEPVLIYEMHLGSWARVPEEQNRVMTYRELAPKVIAHVKALGFNCIELMPIAEHPFTGSWGYQVTGYYAPTSRYGTPDDFRYFVDLCHQHDIGVILDWVPAHFPKDEFALRRFDGTALYEHDDPRRGEHPDWGTLIFNLGRPEVRNFLVANALYWLESFHIDGLRVDAVASMLYLDYSRQEGNWIPNEHGGREDLDAIAFLQQLNIVTHGKHPGCFTIAEESTSWPKVTSPVHLGGLGFTFKWNMGWMHDTLEYFHREPVHRKSHHDQLVFAMAYEYSENFMMPLSHDEVVHGKGSLVQKMAGDTWQKFANLRALFAYQYTRPGKTLLFMGAEFATLKEWNHDQSLDWHLLAAKEHRAMFDYVAALGNLYKDTECLWLMDHDADGFRWIAHDDYQHSVFAYMRASATDHRLVVLNLTPVPRIDYRIGVPGWHTYSEELNSDDGRFGGSDFATHKVLLPESVAWHGYTHSVTMNLPPLSALILTPNIK